MSFFSYLFSQAGGRAPQEQPPVLGLILRELFFTFSHRLEAGPLRNSLLGWASSSVSCFSYLFSQAGGRIPQEQPPGLGLILRELFFLPILTGWRPDPTGTASWAGPHPP